MRKDFGGGDRQAPPARTRRGKGNGEKTRRKNTVDAMATHNNKKLRRRNECARALQAQMANWPSGKSENNVTPWLSERNLRSLGVFTRYVCMRWRPRVVCDLPQWQRIYIFQVIRCEKSIFAKNMRSAFRLVPLYCWCIGVLVLVRLHYIGAYAWVKQPSSKQFMRPTAHYAWMDWSGKTMSAAYARDVDVIKHSDYAK